MKNQNRRKLRVTILKIFLPITIILVLIVYLIYLYFSRKLKPKNGVYLQITLPETDDTPDEAIIEVLSLLHDTENAYYSFELVCDDDGFKILLWICLNGYESKEDAMLMVEECVATSYKDAIVEKVEPNFDKEQIAVSIVMTQPYWYSLKGLSEFKKIETLNFMASMLNNTRLQIVAKPEPQWSAKVEQQLTAMSSGIQSSGTFQDILRMTSQSITRDMAQVQKEATGASKPNLTPIDKAKVSAGWDSLEHPAFMCEMRLLGPDTESLKKAEKVLHRFNRQGANQLAKDRDDMKILEFAKGHDFKRKRVKDKKKMVLPADILGAIWHFGGKNANANNIIHAGARTLPIPQNVPRLESPWLEENLSKL
jgi:hypothetical protein